MKAETHAEQLFFTTAYLTSVSESIRMLGTGFLFRIDSNKGTHLLLVTNKHLIENFNQVNVRFILNDGQGNPILGSSTDFTIDVATCGWIGHPEPSVDVAVVNVSDRLNELTSLGKSAFCKNINEVISLGLGNDFELDALEEVTFIGYPNGIYDTHSMLPFARRGMTATPISLDYLNKPAFVIDAEVYPGSSGSPVFIINQGVIRDRRGNITFGNRIIFLGVVAAYYDRKTDYQIKEVNAAQIATVSESIGLGIVYKAKCIDECAEIFLRIHGYSRVAVVLT